MIGWDGIGQRMIGWDGIGRGRMGLYRGGLVCSSGPDAAFRQMCYLMDYADRA